MGDDKLIGLACRNASFRALWQGETSGVDGDASRADFHLIVRLLHWCDRDTARADRLFRQSGLYRAKWDEKRGDTTYSGLTIANALPHVHESRHEYLARRAREDAAKKPETKPPAGERCQAPFRTLQMHKETGHLHAVFVRCNKNRCPGCLAYKKREEEARVRKLIESHFQFGDALHYLAVPSDQKAKVMRQLSRLRKRGGFRGNYEWTLQPGDDIAILCTAPLPGSKPMGKAEALAKWKEMITTAVPGEGERTVFARGGGEWTKAKTPPPSGESKYEFVGKCKPEPEIREVAQRYGVELLEHWPTRGKCFKRLELVVKRDDPRHGQIKEELSELAEEESATPVVSDRCAAARANRPPPERDLFACALN
jgi:hypothetical protein